MKFLIVVNVGPYQHQSSDTALRFVAALLQQGHELIRVFFYHDGVHNATDRAFPPLDDRNVVQQWSQLIHQYDIECCICVAAAQKRGLLDDAMAQFHGLSKGNMSEGFSLAGLGQLVDACAESDRTVVFGA